MSVDATPPFLMGLQSHWETQAYNLDLPDWHRLWCFGVARSAPNLHAEFATGQLAKLMGKVTDGQFKHMAAPRLSNVIAQSVDRKVLDASSNARCLVLPSHAWMCGLVGNSQPCRTHNGKPSRPRRFRGSPTRKRENHDRPTGIVAGQYVSTSS